MEGFQNHFYIVLRKVENMGMFVNNVRDIGQCRVVIIIIIIIIIIITLLL